jgi:hypothetical protein
MLNPELAGELFGRLDRFFTVAKNPFINSYCNKPDILPCRKELVKEKEEGCAVFTPAQGNRYSIPGDDHLPALYCFCYTEFYVCSKMSPA